MMTSTSALQLPFELVCHIFSFLSFRDANIAASTCRAWYAVFWSSQQRLSLVTEERVLELRCLAPLLRKCSNLLHLELPPLTADCDLEAVAVCSRLQHLGVRRSKFLTDDGLVFLRELRDLRTLVLSCSWNISSRGIALLKPLSSKLQRLELRGCDHVDDEAFDTLAHFDQLVYLDVRDCTRVTDRGLARISHLPALEFLDISGLPNITDTGMTFVALLPALRQLTMWGCDGISDAGIHALAPLGRRLQQLNLLDCKLLTDQTLRTIAASFARLEDLTIGSPQLTGCGAIALRHLDHLSSLTLLASGNMSSFEESRNRLSHLKRCQIGLMWV